MILTSHLLALMSLSLVSPALLQPALETVFAAEPFF